MLKHHAKHVLWLLALGTVVAHACRGPCQLKLSSFAAAGA